MDIYFRFSGIQSLFLLIHFRRQGLLVSSMAAAVIIGKREDHSDEVGNQEVPESFFVSECITGTPGSGVRIVGAQQKYYHGLYGGSFKGQE